MANLFEGERTFLHPVLRPLERLVYKLCGIDETHEQHWTHYAGSLLAFSLVGILLTYLIQRIQGMLPFNPQGFAGKLITPDLAFNTAVSFGTNTNWQVLHARNHHELLHARWWGWPPTTSSSAAAGIAIAIAVVRGFARHSANTLGNFWVDFTRSTLYLLIPLSIVGALLLVSQGCHSESPSLQQSSHARRRRADHRAGPAGFAGSHQDARHQRRRLLQRQLRASFREPHAVFEFPADAVHLRDPGGSDLHLRQDGEGHAPGMGAVRRHERRLFLAGVFVVYPAEAVRQSDPDQTGHGDSRPPPRSRAATWKARKCASASPTSALFTVITTDASCGAVNNMHDSLTPLGGLVPLVNIELGEVIFGGVGAGLYGMLLFAILAVFIAGLMVGRTPEYLGKKIEQKEVKMVMLAVLVLAFSILCFRPSASRRTSPRTAGSIRPGRRTANLTNNGPHGFSEMLYAYTSGTGQQRQRLRRHQRQHAVLQHHHRLRHAVRPVPDDDSAAGRGGQPGAEETGAGFGRHLPHARAAVRGPAGGRGGDRGRADVLPGAFARPVVEHFLMHARAGSGAKIMPVMEPAPSTSYVTEPFADLEEGCRARGRCSTRPSSSAPSAIRSSS